MGTTKTEGAYMHMQSCNKHGCTGRTRYIIRTTHGKVPACRDHKDDGVETLKDHPDVEVLGVDVKGSL